ncbi:hypothetical protein ABPG75_007890 [Micractinium tetrahymenae]
MSSPAPIEALVEELKAAFAAERKRGEALDYVSQSGESFQRLDAAVRGAVDRFLVAPGGGFAAAAPYLNFNDTHYTRNLVAENEDFELMVLCWGKGQGSRVHNHARSHGWVTALAGRVEETRYNNPRDGLHDYSAPTSPREGPAPPPALPGVLAATAPCPELQELGKVVGGPGALLYINDGIGLHAVRCADDTNLEEGAVTLHLYAPPVRRVFLYEPEEDRVVQRVPGLYSRGGVRCQ